MSSSAATGAAVGTPRIILRAEGAALFLAAVFVFWRLGGSWLLFLVLFLAPDLSFLAYLSSPRLGAAAYNVVHTTLGPLALFALGYLFDAALVEGLAAIWLAHVGIDRALGYGLKYATAFNDTHLGRIGR
ncbi:MAG TPA: DUF4260 domain-containing protein [Roseiarcus sp.]|nr:DUF4260 domain-containing protein [Roseiarcus sp.]